MADIKTTRLDTSLGEEVRRAVEADGFTADNTGQDDIGGAAEGSDPPPTPTVDVAVGLRWVGNITGAAASKDPILAVDHARATRPANPGGPGVNATPDDIVIAAKSGDGLCFEVDEEEIIILTAIGVFTEENDATLSYVDRVGTYKEIVDTDGKCRSVQLIGNFKPNTINAGTETYILSGKIVVIYVGGGLV